MALRATQSVEHRPKTFAGFLDLDEVRQADPKKLELIGGDAAQRIARLRRTPLRNWRGPGRLHRRYPRRPGPCPLRERVLGRRGSPEQQDGGRSD
jgi:hypothetical protein